MAVGRGTKEAAHCAGPHLRRHITQPSSPQLYRRWLKFIGAAHAFHLPARSWLHRWHPPSTSLDQQEYSMQLKTKAIVACAALTAASAFAQTSGIAGSGLYVGGSVGGSHWKGDDQLGTADDKSDTGLKVYGGYSFTPNIAIEFGAVDLGKFTGPTGDARANGVYLDGVGTVPIGYGFSALGRIGIVNGQLKTDAGDADRGTNLKVGLGLQYDITPNIGVRTEWERYRFDSLDGHDNADLYSVGLNYRF
jgi:OmpA-OmpF porin, OOP family